MKKLFRSCLLVSVCVVIALLFFASYTLQIYLVNKSMLANSDFVFKQIDKSLENNTYLRQKRVQEQEEKVKRITQHVLYIIDNHYDVLGSGPDLENILQTLNVEEINIFDAIGRYAVSTNEARYKDSNIRLLGEKKQFVTLLNNHKFMVVGTTRLLPNSEPLYYMTTWTKDSQFIVQVGFKLDELIQNDSESYNLQKDFNNILNPLGVVIYAINDKTGTVEASTATNMVGRSLENVGINKSNLEDGILGFYYNSNGKQYYAKSVKMGDMYFVRAIDTNVLYSSVLLDAVEVLVFMILVAAICYLIADTLISKFVLKDLNKITAKISEISKGNLKVNVDTKSTPEFAELGNNINMMQSRLADIFNTQLNQYKNQNLSNSYGREDESENNAPNNVLLIDDNEINLELNKAFLEELGYNVEVSNSSTVAIGMVNMAQAGYYSCIFMNMIMGEGDSLDIVKSIRNLSNKDKGATPIVLFVDSVSYDDDYKKAKNEGVNECLHKPLNIEEAEQKLSKII